MSLRNYLESFQRALEKLRDYNTLHKPALAFKEHKHTKEGAIISAHSPEISAVIDEVIKCL